MIMRYSGGYPMSNNDTMDSAVRISILCLDDNVTRDDVALLLTYEKDGIVVRCPYMAPANNPNNCTRDQTKMLVEAYRKIGRPDIVRRIFWAHFRRGFFCQNSERDKPLSKKYPFPHSFYKDSYPTYETKTPFNNVKFRPGFVIEKRLFDFRDPLGPNDIWQMIVAGELKWFYWFKPIGMFFHRLALKHTTKGEFNQLIAECSALGTLKDLNENWKMETIAYWKVRDEIEYSRILIKYVEGAM